MRNKYVENKQKRRKTEKGKRNGKRKKKKKKTPPYLSPGQTSCPDRLSAPSRKRRPCRCPSGTPIDFLPVQIPYTILHERSLRSAQRLRKVYMSYLSLALGLSQPTFELWAAASTIGSRPFFSSILLCLLLLRRFLEVRILQRLLRESFTGCFRQIASPDALVECSRRLPSQDALVRCSRRRIVYSAS